MDGRFVTAAPDGSYALSVSGDGWKPVEETPVALVGESADVVLRVRRTATP